MSTTKGLFWVCLIATLIGLVNVIARPAVHHSVGDAEEGNTNRGLSIHVIHHDHLVQINLLGAISSEPDSHSGLLSDESNAMQAKKALEKALKDTHVKGVLLRIDSPGGTVGMSQELNAAVHRLSVAKKPVVVSIGDLAASGGYYTACAADRIVANPGSLTGSIGVIIHSMNLQHLLVDKLGLQPVTIKSGKFKDILSPYRDSTPEERTLLQQLVMNSYHQFINAVIDGRTRGIRTAQEKVARAHSIRAIADGRILIAEEAKKVGLIDEIGDAVDARKLLNRLATAENGAVSNLPLEDNETGNKLLNLLGLESAFSSRLPIGQLFSGSSALAGLPDALPPALIPFSARHPNQLLWMYE